MLRHLLTSAFFVTSTVSLAFAQQQAQQPAPAAKPKPRPAAAAAKKPGATTPSDKARLIQKIKDWNVFVYEGVGGRVCFAASAPTDMQPKAAKRTPVIFYVTTWQKDGVRNEVSVKQGYPLKANSTANVTVSGQKFVLTAEDDKAFVKEAAMERKLLAAMARGGPMTVQATSAKGTVTTDQYSLDGVSEAVQKLQEACP
jgi:hypothetical protein